MAVISNYSNILVSGRTSIVLHSLTHPTTVLTVRAVKNTQRDIELNVTVD